MSSIYPDSIDGYAQLPLVVDTITPVNAESVNRLRSAIVNIETELGIMPSGDYIDVRTRLDDINASIGDIESDIDSIYADLDSINTTIDLILDIIDSGASNFITLTAAEDLITGDLIAINSSGEAEKANAGATSINKAFVVGTSDGSFLAGALAQIKSSQGALVPVRFASPPAASTNGMRVYVSTTSGEGTFFPDASPGKVIYFVGIMQGADGVSPFPDVLFSPNYLSRT